MTSDEDLDENSQDELKNQDTFDEDEEDEEYDDNATCTTDVSNREDSENFRDLLRHIDDDGEKGLKLINVNQFFKNLTNFTVLI